MNKSPEDVFIQEVPKAFIFLVSEFGFNLSKRHDCLFEATSPQCIVLIGNDWPGLYIALKPSTESTGIGNRARIEPIGLSWIVNYLYPDIHYSETKLNTVDQIPAELHRQANVLKRFCSRFLNGEFSRWEEIVDFIGKKNTWSG